MLQLERAQVAGTSPAARAARRRRRRSPSSAARRAARTPPARAGARRTTRSTRRHPAAPAGCRPRRRAVPCPRRESSVLSASASRSVGIIPVRPSGSAMQLGRSATNELRAFSGRRPTSSPSRPSSSQRPTPRALRERKLSAAPSMTKPSTRSVRSFPPSLRIRSMRMTSTLGNSASSVARPRQPGDPSPDDDDLHRRPAPHELRERLDEHRIVVQRGRALEPHRRARSATARARTSTSNRISTWSETNPTGTTTTSRTPRAASSREMVSEVGPGPRLGRAPGGLVAPRPALLRRSPRAPRRGARSRGTARRTGRRSRARARGGCAR